MVSEVTTQSWFSRIAGALVGILFGIALIVATFVFIFWNESHGLRMTKSLQQTAETIITVPASPINNQNNLRVVYVTGAATTTENLSDNELNVTVNALKLAREVEMYQWQENSSTETEHQLGGSEKTTTTYSYEPVWSDNVISSKKFKEVGHENPVRMPIASVKNQAHIVKVGDFTLVKDLISKLSGETKFDPSKIDAGKLQEKLKKPVHIVDDYIYIGENPDQPKVGDARISVNQLLPQTISVIAQQAGNALQFYFAPAGDQIGLISVGQHSSEELIFDALKQNQIMIWLLRLVSLFLMMIGVALIFRPLAVIVDAVPFIGSIIDFSLGFVSFFGGLLLWSAATAFAWMLVRPTWSLILIVVALTVCASMFFRKKPAARSVKRRRRKK